MHDSFLWRARPLWLVSALLVVGCGAAPAKTSAKAWMARGDAALASDPGRAVANYEQAEWAARAESRAPKGAPTAPLTEIEAKSREAARRWLRAEIDRHSAQPETAPENVLGWVEAVRAEASSRHVLDTFEPELVAIERRVRRKLYDDKKTELAKTSGLEGLLSFAALRKAVPKGESELEADASGEVERRRAELLARLRANAGADHAGAAVLRRRLVAGVTAAPERAPTQAFPPEIARAGRIGWQAEATGCEGVERAVSSLEHDGAQRGVLRLAVQCATAAVKHKVTRTVMGETVTEVPVYTDRDDCTSQEVITHDRGCIRNLNGDCTQTVTSCKKVSVRTGTRIVRKKVQVQKDVDEPGIDASARGTLVIEVDGASKTIPIDVHEVFGDAKELPSPAQALRALVISKLSSAVTNATREQEKARARDLLARASRQLAEGDELAAQDTLASALALGAGAPDVPRSFEQVAAKDGLTFDGWVALAVREQPPTVPSVSFLAPARSFDRPSHPGPDEEAVRVDRDVTAQEGARAATRSAFAEADASRLGFGAGLVQWDSYGGEAGAGVSGSLNLRGGGGGALPFYFYDANVALESSIGGGFGLGVDALGRLGLGARSKYVWLAPYFVGGGSGRGTTDSALYVPLGLDAGAGARLAVMLDEDMAIELFAERISRPTRPRGDATRPIVQRMRYELRFVSRDRGGDIGGAASCSFHQLSAEDFVWPVNGIRSRSCEAAFFSSF